MKFFRKISLVVAIFLVSFVPVNSTFAALTESQLNFYAQNNILFYDPGGCVTSTLRSAPADPIEAASSGYGALSATQVGFVDRFHDIAVKNSINYGIPWEAVMAQGILESAAGTSPFATQRYNYFGINAVDSNPDLAYGYASPEKGWEGYYEFIQKNSNYRQNGVFSGDAVTDPYAYIRAVKAAGYATAPDYVPAVSAVIDAVRDYSDSRGWKSSAELAKEYPEWEENAAKNSKGASVPNTGVDVDTVSPNMIEFCISEGGELVSGGMTLEQAKAFMEIYKNLAIQYRNAGSATVDGIFYKTFCTDGPFANCSAFSRWFVAKYTDAGDTTQTNGGVYASSLASRGFQTGSVPRPYAIFSSSGTTSAGHTGVILGVNEEKGTVIIGEANCGLGINGIRAREVNISSLNGYTYAYTDGRLSGGL